MGHLREIFTNLCFTFVSSSRCYPCILYLDQYYVLVLQTLLSISVYPPLADLCPNVTNKAVPSLNVFPIAVFRVSAEDAATNAPECGGGEGEVRTPSLHY